MTREADFSEAGIIPLRDHEKGVPISIRRMMVGGIIEEVDQDGFMVCAEIAGHHSFGDFNFGTFWPAGGRGFGSSGFYITAVVNENRFAAETGQGGRVDEGTPEDMSGPRPITPGSGAVTPGARPPSDRAQPGGRTLRPGGEGMRPSTTGTPPEKTDKRPIMLPVYRATYEGDTRYESIAHSTPRHWPRLPKYTVVASGAGAQEDELQRVVTHGDPTIIVSQTSGVASMSTIFADLGPKGVIARGPGEKPPGLDTKSSKLARSNSLFIVVKGPETLCELPYKPGNLLAISLNQSVQDEIAGYGPTFQTLVKKQDSDGPQGGTPKDDKDPVITPGSGITPGARAPSDGGGEGGLGEYRPPNPATGDPGNPGPAQPILSIPEEGGDEKEKETPPMVACAFLSWQAGGPFHAGDDNDKHRISENKDGVKFHPQHLWTNALWFMDKEYDAPLEFQQEKYAHPGPMPIVTRVHLRYDDRATHPFPPCGNDQPGKWRWQGETIVLPTKPRNPEPREPVDPVPPGDPGTPGDPGPGDTPTTPGPDDPPTTPAPTTPGTPEPGRRQPTTPGPGAGEGGEGEGPGPGEDGGGGGGEFGEPPDGEPDGDPEVGPIPRGPASGLGPGVQRGGGGPRSGGGSGDPGTVEGADSDDGSSEGGGGEGPEDEPNEGGEDDGGSGSSGRWPRPRGWIPPDERPPGTDPFGYPWGGSPYGSGWNLSTAAGGAGEDWNYHVNGAFDEDNILDRRVPVQQTDHAAYDAEWMGSIMLQTAHSAMLFRAQSSAADVDLRYSIQPGMDSIVAQNLRQPGVLRAQAWGAEIEGTFDYTTVPGESRVGSGTSDGGVQLTPPEYDLEDISPGNADGSGDDTYDVPTGAGGGGSTGYLAAGDGVCLAFGHANRATGGVQDGAVTMGRDTADSDKPLVVSQQRSGSPVDIMSVEADPNDGPYVTMEGTGATRLPAGSTAQRPATAPQDGDMRVNTDDDAIDYYSNGAWHQPGGGGGSTVDHIAVFDATGGAPIGAAPTPIPQDTVTNNSDATNFSMGGGVITVQDDGTYQIEVDISVAEMGIAADQLTGMIQIQSPSGTGGWVTLPGTVSHGTVAVDTSETRHSFGVWVESGGAGFDVRAAASSPGGSLMSLGNAGRIKVMKMG